VEALQDKYPYARLAAAEALWSIEKSRLAVAALVEALQDKDPHARLVAAKALWSIEKSQLALPVLSAGLTAGPFDSRCWAAKALSEMGPAAKDAVPALRNALKDEDPLVRIDAACALWHIAQSKDGFPVLSDLILDTEAEVGGLVARSMAPMGPVAIPILAEGLEHTDHGDDAANALAKIGKPSVPALLRALHCRDFFGRWNAAWALGAIGPDAKEAVPALTKSLEDEEPLVRIAAARALWQIERSKAGVPVLIEVIRNEDKGSNERWRAVGVLEKMEPEATAATESPGPQLD